jgi:ATP-dependent RNA helicase DeaD
MAFTFVSGQEIYKLQSMVRWARLDIRRGKIPSLDEVEEARTSVFFEKIRSTLEAKNFKPHDRMIDRLLDQGYASTDICSALIHLLQGAAGTGGPGAKGGAAPKAAPITKSAPAYAEKSVKPAPAWAKPVAAPKAAPVAPPPEPAEAGETEVEREREDDDGHPDSAPRKSKYERPARTGREPGFATIFLNVGRKQLVTPADIVGKIAGVTRLPATIVGAIDIHQRHTLVDVAEAEADFVVQKLTGIKVKSIALEPARAGNETKG